MVVPVGLVRSVWTTTRREEGTLDPILGLDEPPMSTTLSTQHEVQFRDRDNTLLCTLTSAYSIPVPNVGDEVLYQNISFWVQSRRFCILPDVMRWIVVVGPK